MIDELISTLEICNVCSNALSQDEKVINARFIQHAARDGHDISMFPICIKCNFECVKSFWCDHCFCRNLLLVASTQRLRKIDTNGAKPGKRVVGAGSFGNSEEFTQLGTFTKANRNADYYIPDTLVGIG